MKDAGEEAIITMDRAKIVDYFLGKLEDKNFSILDVRQELEKNNIDEEEIRVIVKLVDSELRRKITNKSSADSSREIVWLGGSITLAGLVLTIGTYTGLIDMGNYFVLAYGPILGGISILFYGRNRKR